MQLTISQGIPVTVVAVVLALIGCMLGLLSLHAAVVAGSGRQRLAWLTLASFGIGVDAVCGPQIAEIVSISYFGGNCQESGGAIAEEILVGVVASFVASAVLVITRLSLPGAILGGLFLGTGTVLAHAALLTGLVNPTVDLGSVPLIVSAVVSCVLAAVALRLFAQRSRAAEIVALVLLAVTTALAERIDLSAATIRADAPALTASVSVPLTGIQSDQLLAPLLAAVALSVIALFFTAMQTTLADGRRRLRASE